MADTKGLAAVKSSPEMAVSADADEGTGELTAVQPTCPAIYMGMVYKHTCGRTGAHTVHKCSKEHCAVEWVDGATYSQLSDNGQPEHK